MIRAKEPILSADQQPIYLAEVNEFESAKFVCSSSGSNPAAQIEWSLRQSNGQVQNLTGSYKTTSVTGATRTTATTTNGPRSQIEPDIMSTSSLEIPAIGRHNHLAELICKAKNENLSQAKHGLDASLIARVKLSVKCKLYNELVRLSSD